MKQIRRHLTYANVMSSIAVFLMLGGATALAATKIGAGQLKANSVKTGKIVKEAVTAGKLKNGAVTTGKLANAAVTSEKLADNAVTTTKIADNAVTTAKIANDAVTGAKAKESTFSEVPSAASATNATNATNAINATNATNANNADTVGGNTVEAVNFVASPPVGPTEILDLNGFTLTASCSAGDVLSVVANGPNGSRLQSAGNESGPVESKIVDSVFSDSLTPTSNLQLLPTDDDLVNGKTEFSLGEGVRAVSVVWEAEGFAAGANPHCTFTGYAIG